VENACGWAIERITGDVCRPPNQSAALRKTGSCGRPVERYATKTRISFKSTSMSPSIRSGRGVAGATTPAKAI